MFDPKASPPATIDMLSLFLKIAVPSMCTNVLAFGTVVTNTIFAGTLEDPINLAVVGLTGTCIVLMFQSFMIGLNSAQETLTSQAFGAGNLRLCGVYLNRGHFILLTAFVPLAIMPWFFAERIFLALGQDADVARMTKDQVLYMLPSSFFYCNYDLQKRWMAC
jgi:multidrug resistance protein, MATE family